MALVVFLFATACTVPRGSTEMKMLGKGAYAATPDAAAVAAFDERHYRETWSRMVGSGEAPAVDFEKNAVVFLFAGMRPTGGWSVEPRGVTLDGETLVVDAGVKGPRAGTVVTQALTSPYAVISISNRAFKSVRWNEATKTAAR